MFHSLSTVKKMKPYDHLYRKANPTHITQSIRSKNL
jgi:hypothetical protein